MSPFLIWFYFIYSAELFYQYRYILFQKFPRSLIFRQRLSYKTLNSLESLSIGMISCRLGQVVIMAGQPSSIGLSRPSRDFEYVWVIRGSGTRSVEYRMLPHVRGNALLPLLEVTDGYSFPAFATRLRSYFGSVMVDVPQYLLDYSNKFREQADGLLRVYPDPINFLVSFKSWIDIPVASSRLQPIPDYSVQRNAVGRLIQDFQRVAVRLFVPSVDITQISVSINSYIDLLKNVPEGSIILLDIPEVSGNEAVVAANVREMSSRASQLGHKLYVINAFDPDSGGHNFGPYLAFENQLKGFGDLATEHRWPPTGGGGYPTAIIRYYDFQRYVVEEFRERLGGYEQAAQRLVGSTVWQNHVAHRRTCPACSEVSRGAYQLSSAYWKQFRLEHYIASILHDTRNQYSAVTNPQDLDPDGHDVIVRQSQFQP